MTLSLNSLTLKVMKDKASILFSSISAFSLLIFLSPVISTLLLGLQLQVVFAAPLMATTVVSILFYFISRSGMQIHRRWNIVFLALFPFSVLASFHVLTWIQRAYDQDIFNHAANPKAFYLEQLIQQSAVAQFNMLTLAVISIPYIVYGILLSLFFYNNEKKISFFKVEMLGALIGSLIMSPVLEFLNFSGSLIFVVLMGSVACVFQLRKKVILAGSVLILPAGLAYFAVPFFEPQRDLHLVARDFQKNSQVSLLSEDWNVYSKVQTLELANERGSRRVIAIGDGTGIARLRKFSDQGRIENIFARALKALKPRAADVAVLFAGAGADMLDIDRAYEGKTHITGVEINRQLISQALLNSDEKIRVFFARPEIHLLNAEARGFLRKNQQKFDALIYSWSGATMAHYSGAIMHTTQYAFTEEALTEALQAVQPEGYLIIAGGSKVNLILSLQQIAKRHPLPDLKNSLALLGSPKASAEEVFRNWDNVILIWKNGSLSKEELERLQTEFNKPEDYTLVLSPFMPGLDVFEKFNELISTSDSAALVRQLRQTQHSYFDAFTDDRPFVYNAQDPADLFEMSFWKMHFQNIFRAHPFASPWSFFLTVLLVSLVMGAVILKSKSHSLGVRRCLASYLCGVVASGLSIYIIYLMLFYIQQPSLVLQCGLGLGFCASILFSQWKLSDKTFRSLLLSLIVVSVAAGVGLYFISALGLLGAFIFLAFVFGAMFPFLIRHSSQESSSPFFAVFSLDSLGALAATLLVPLLIENWGFQKVGWILLGLIFVTASLLFVKKTNCSNDTV